MNWCTPTPVTSFGKEASASSFNLIGSSTKSLPFAARPSLVSKITSDPFVYNQAPAGNSSNDSSEVGASPTDLTSPITSSHSSALASSPLSTANSSSSSTSSASLNFTTTALPLNSPTISSTESSNRSSFLGATSVGLQPNQQAVTTTMSVTCASGTVPCSVQCSASTAAPASYVAGLGSLDLGLSSTSPANDIFAPSIILRKLPSNTTSQSLRCMLLFAKDLIDVDFVSLKHPDDVGFLSAVARFKTHSGANEARDRLNGKANMANSALMIVDFVQDNFLPKAKNGSSIINSLNSLSMEADTSCASNNLTATAVAPAPLRYAPTTTSTSGIGIGSSCGSAGGLASAFSATFPLPRQPSRFSETFLLMERNVASSCSPSITSPHGDSFDLSSSFRLADPHPTSAPSSSTSSSSNLFNNLHADAQASIPNSVSRMMNNSHISQLATNGVGNVGAGNNANNTVAPLRFPGLSLNTHSHSVNTSEGNSSRDNHSPFVNFVSPLSCLSSPVITMPPPISSLQSPHSGGNGSGTSVGANSTGSTNNGIVVNGAGSNQKVFHFPNAAQAYPQRHALLPPVNPADQNPPCNTLYVGNLPAGTSEEELKAMFSKQRGYKRLCFRTKQKGPMCFVEFEDVSFATKALNELYGHPLHNSVKGGIRLSFSKNPLGVRSSQNTNSSNLVSPSTPRGLLPSGGTHSTSSINQVSHCPMPPVSSVVSLPPGLSQTSNSSNIYVSLPSVSTTPTGAYDSSLCNLSSLNLGLNLNNSAARYTALSADPLLDSQVSGLNNNYSAYMMGR